MDWQRFLLNDRDDNALRIAKEWAATSGLKIVAIFIAAFVIWKLSHILIRKFISRVIIIRRYESKRSKENRERTLAVILNSTMTVIIISVAFLMILQEFGVATGPILAAAGVAGLAVGFGGQYLIKDIVTGLFITMENQYSVGDVVCFDDTCGLVEDITLRMTTLRDQSGTVYHVPHGEVKKVANLTKDFSRVNLNVRIPYDANLEKVIKIVNAVGKELAEDPVWKESITKAPEFLRVEDFADSAMIIKILGDTQPIRQWDVTGELRKRLKIAFEKEGIEIPLPQMVIRQSK